MTQGASRSSDEPADVCLVLEGTYPYVQGGVSSWVHQIVSELPEITFAIFYLGSLREHAVKQRYTPPANVISMTELFLFEKLPDEELESVTLPRKSREEFYATLEKFYLAESPDGSLDAFWNVIDVLDKLSEAGHAPTFANLSRDGEAWDLLQAGCQKIAPDESFIDFFWTVRYVHLPVWIALQGRSQLPPAKMYHSVSTGYAGFLGAIAARRHHVPYLITEHGIYTKERIAEISQADWIYDPPGRYFDIGERMSPFKQLWIDLFTFIGRVSYARADHIVGLFAGIHKLQIEFGAAPDRLEAIPNGINPAKFDAAYKKRMDRLAHGFGGEIVIGFIGRVVPIKDVKTLIRAAGTIVTREPRAVFHIIGPTEEDPDYFAECQLMTKLMGLEKKIIFTGSQNIREMIHTLDVCLLTSISEGLPLIILEAFAAGIPCVATDVGACRELIYGRTPEDKALGPAGALTNIASPLDTANAVLATIASVDTLITMGKAGRIRTERHYREDEIMGKYRDFYTDHSWAAKPISADAKKGATH